MTLLECHLCQGPLRHVKSDGRAVYVNGDRTTTPVKGTSRCGCGFKHYWNGREYDNMPERSKVQVTAILAREECAESENVVAMPYIWPYTTVYQVFSVFLDKYSWYS